MKVGLLLALLAACGWATEAATTQPPPPPNTADSDNDDSASNTLPPPPPPPPAPVGTGAEGPGGQQQPPPPPPPPPVWVQCLSGAPQGGTLPDLFQFWCSNYNQIIPCLASGLTTDAARNPLDQFVQLHFDSEQMKTRSEQLCPNFQGLGSRSQCTQQNNASVEGWCHARFSQGQQYVFAVRSQRAFDNDDNVYRDLACQVVNDTTGCLGSAMTGCDVETKRHLLAFYAFFTNESCLADPSAEYATPAPPPPRDDAPRDVVITCAQRIAEALTPNPPSQNASQLEQLLYGLQQNCRTFEARYNCYHEELNKIEKPSFRDIWLSFTFDSTNAIQSQRQFCQAFEGGIADALTVACYNGTQPLLQQCEEQYGQGVVSIQGQWINKQLDNVGLHKAACQTSIQRAFCLQNAFRLCGEVLAEAMLNSELRTLPNICLSLLPGNTTTTATTDTDNAAPATTTDDHSHFREPAAESEPVGNAGPERDSESTPPPLPAAEQNEGGEKPSSGQSHASTGAAATDKDEDSLASGLGCSFLVLIFTGIVSLFVLV